MYVSFCLFICNSLYSIQQFKNLPRPFPFLFISLFPFSLLSFLSHIPQSSSLFFLSLLLPLPLTAPPLIHLRLTNFHTSSMSAILYVSYPLCQRNYIYRLKTPTSLNQYSPFLLKIPLLSSLYPIVSCHLSINRSLLYLLRLIDHLPHDFPLCSTPYLPQGKLANSPNTDSGTDPAAIAAVRFCLSLFSSSLKRNKLDQTDSLVLSMAAPFVPLLGQCLRLTGAVDVVTLATRCLCSILTWNIQVESSFIQAVGKCKHTRE